MNDRSQQGYSLIEAGLSYYFPTIVPDQEVKILGYVIRNFEVITGVPRPDLMSVIPVKRYNFYPAIGIHVEKPAIRGSAEEAAAVSQLFFVETKIENWVKRTGLERLIELSLEETLTWQAVMDSFAKAYENVP